MTHHWAVVMEAVGLAILLVATVLLWRRGRREGLGDHRGWTAILAGLGLLLLGTLADLLEDFALSGFPDALGGATGQDFLENVLLRGGGFLLLAIGLLRWIPLPLRLESAKEELARANEQLEQRVEEATRELRSSQARLNHLLENAPAGIYTAEPDPPYATTFASESFAHVYGVDLSLVLDDPAAWFDRVHPEDQDRVDANMQALRTEEHLSQEYRFRGEDGALRCIRDDMQLIRDEDGTPVEIVGSALDVTDRKRLEEELARRKDQLEMTIGTTDMVLYSIDPDGIFTLSEGRGLESLGLEPGEVVGQDIEDVYADHPEILDAFDEALEGEPTRFETEVAGACWESQFVPRLDEDGTVTAVDGVAVDVTERVEAERELREANELFDTIAGNLPAVLYTTGTQASDIRYVSPAAEDLLGLEPSRIIEDPSSILEVVAPEDRDELAARLSGPPTTDLIEFRVDHPTRGRRWLRASTHPIRGADGEPDEWVGIALDVTDQAEAERQLREANELFDTIAGNLHAVLYKTETAVAEMEYVSPAAEDVFGVDADTILAEPERLLEVVAPEDRERLAQKLLQPPTGEPVEAQIDHPTKGRRWVRASSYPIGDGDGDPEAWVGIAVDVTDERRMLALQQESARVARELEQAREMEAFKDRFLNMAAHELVTPLTPLRFQIDALQEGVVGEPSDEQLEALAVADRSVDRLEHLIANLVDATDLQAGDLELKEMPADLLEIVEDALDLADRLHGDGLPLEPDLAGPVALVADAARLRRAVTSVVLEAAEHRKDRSDPVHVDLEPDDERAHLTIEIFVAALDAPGFEELFEPFEGVDDHGDVRAEGTGLGLFVARGVIEAHGGSIDASSDGGLRFRIEIPLGEGIEPS